MSPGVAIPWPAAPPMPMARSILFTPRLLSESERFGDSLLVRSCAGPRQFCAVRSFRSRSARAFWRAIVGGVVALRDPVLVASSAGAPAPAMPARWIVSRRFDLGWFFGGAALSLAVVGLYFGVGLPILVLWWTWLLAFDGPHIAAAFTRTYLDREEWRARRGVLLRGLLIIAVGPLFLLLGLAMGSADPFQLFLGLATLYGYYHIVRQHY